MKKSISLFLTFFMLTNYSYANDQPSSQSEDKPIYSGTSSPTKDRLRDEYSTQFDENVMTPHKMNYFLPVSYTDGINRGAYQDLGDDFTEGLEDIEIKIQLSLKVPLNYDSMFIEGDSLYFSFTIASWWQAYASEISEPFRETNYQPELFYIAPTQWHPNDANVAWLVGFEHQSNGRSGSFSRSWNRAYIGGIYEKDNYSLLLRPWVILDKSGDNPDIQDYMGNFELTAGYRMDNLKFTALGRRNFSEGNGYLQLGATFPIWGRLRGYVQLSNGYGESLVDYNYSQSVFGLGIAISDLI